MILILNIKAPFDTTNLLKIKQSELRLYCDLLQQQTHEMKNLVISIKSSIGLPENGLKMNISGLKLESMIIVRNTEGKFKNKVFNFNLIKVFLHENYFENY